jgi:hypothetical protein
MVICKLAVRQMCTNTLIILIFTTENVMNNVVDVCISFANLIRVKSKHVGREKNPSIQGPYTRMLLPAGTMGVLEVEVVSCWSFSYIIL